MCPLKVTCAASIVLAALLCLAPNLRAQDKSEADADSNDTARQAEALLQLSFRQNLEDHALALQTAQQSLAIWQASADNVGVARAYAQIGRCHFAQSNFPEAVQNFEEARQLWRDLNNTRQQAEMMIQLGYVGIRKGEWQDAISLFTQAQSLVEEKNDPLIMGQIADGLGGIFTESGSPEKGLVQYQRALDYYRQTPDTRAVTQMISVLGNTYYLLGNYPEAEAYLTQALEGSADRL